MRIHEPYGRWLGYYFVIFVHIAHELVKYDQICMLLGTGLKQVVQSIL